MDRVKRVQRVEWNTSAGAPCPCVTAAALVRSSCTAHSEFVTTLFDPGQPTLPACWAGWGIWKCLLTSQLGRRVRCASFASDEKFMRRGASGQPEPAGARSQIHLKSASGWSWSRPRAPRCPLPAPLLPENDDSNRGKNSVIAVIGPHGRTEKTS